MNMQKFKELLQVYEDAVFEAGEWDKNYNDESYDSVSARVEHAKQELTAYVQSAFDRAQGW